MVLFCSGSPSLLGNLTKFSGHSVSSVWQPFYYTIQRFADTCFAFIKLALYGLSKILDQQCCPKAIEFKLNEVKDFSLRR